MELWKSKVEVKDFSDFGELDSFIRESGWETTDESLEIDISRLIVQHLIALGENLEVYFPAEDNERIDSDAWVLNPFVRDDGVQVDAALLELREDFVQKSNFKSLESYQDFWVQLVSIPEYQGLAEAAISVLIRMPTTYLCEQGFSTLTVIKSKQRNSILALDPLMRGALELRIKPRFELIANDREQFHPSH